MNARPNFGFDLANEMTFFYLVFASSSCHGN